MKFILFVLAFTYLFYLLFLVYAAYKSAKDAGRHISTLVLVLIALPIAVGYLIDVAWNATIGSALFREWPWAGGWKVWRWTFTARLKRWKSDPGSRGRQVQFWASLILPFDPSHL